MVILGTLYAVYHLGITQDNLQDHGITVSQTSLAPWLER